MPPSQPQQTREQFLESLFKLEKRDNISTGKKSREKLITGINKVVDVVKQSYGSAGSNCIIESTLPPFHEVINDGKKIADSIKLSDPVENIGANIVKEVAAKSDRESGDGRKTSMILLQAILEEGLKAKEDPMVIKKSLDECLPIILKSIDEQTKEITPDKIGRVAAVACEDEKLGHTFQEIYQKIGKDGIIELDNSGTSDTYYEITEGVRLLNCRYQYQYMAQDDKGRKAIRENPFVLISKQRITNINQIDPVFKWLYKQGKKDLVIFCDEIDDQVSSLLYQYHQGFTREIEGVVANIKFNVLVIKAPIVWKDWLLEDFAKITGATVIDGITLQLKQLQLHHLGTCTKVISSKDETVVLGIQNIKDHIDKLLESKTDEAKIRVARLQTKTAILKLGANSESELSYIKGKALDARNSSFLALQGGVVQGAGRALYNIGKSLTGTDTGSRILHNALKAPYEIIKSNMSGTTITPDILDSAIVVKNAITNALSIASTILTTNNVITLVK